MAQQQGASTSLSIAKKYGAKENILLYRQPDCCEERNAMLVQCKKTTTLKSIKIRKKNAGLRQLASFSYPKTTSAFILSLSPLGYPEKSS